MGKEMMQADIICICSGADFETLYPDTFSSTGLTKCKLQMMRFKASSENWRINTSVCGGLSLIHYQSFQAAASLGLLKNRYETEMADFLKWGIHVMVSQNDKFELTVGDSHEYGQTFDPFDKAFINQMILDYLGTFMESRDWKLIQSWNGIYPKMTNGETDLFLQPEQGVFILNGLGGAGMTLSFGFAEETIKSIDI
jgi:FAD dependent oxidoreductase TIGR03364